MVTVYVSLAAMSTDRGMTKVDDRFEKHSPFITILLFTIGPAAALIQTLADTIETIEISWCFKSDKGEYAMSVIGFTPVMIMCVQFVGAYFAQAILAQVSRLLGEGKQDLARQVVADVARIGMCFSVVFASTFWLVISPFLKYVSCTEDVFEAAYHFCLVLIVGTPLIVAYFLCFSLVQSMGRPVLNFVIRLCAAFIQVAAITPMLLWGVGVKIDYIKCSPLITDLIIVVAILVIMGKTTNDMKIPLACFVKTPIKESFKALALALPAIVQFLSYSIPTMLTLRAMVAIDPVHGREISASIGVWNKMNVLSISVIAMFAGGFLTPATHAFGMGNSIRFLKLVGWGMFFVMVPFVVLWPIFVFKPEWIAGLFMTSESDIEYAKRIIMIPFVTFPAHGITAMGVMSLTAMGKPLVPIILSSIQVVVLCVGCKIIGDLLTGDAHKVMYIYNIADVSTATMYIVALIVHLVPMFRDRKAYGHVDEISEVADRDTDEVI